MDLEVYFQQSKEKMSTPEIDLSACEGGASWHFDNKGYFSLYTLTLQKPK